MKKSYRVRLDHYVIAPEVKPTETTEIKSSRIQMDVFIMAASIADAQEGAMAYAVKMAPDVPWEINCVELMNDPCCRNSYPWN